MKTTGIIKKIIGPVVDVDFGEVLPDIYSALEVINGSKKIILEVEQHLGGGVVRAVAMDTTDGLARGVEVTDTGAPISVPVGSATLGRIFNVLGEAIDDGKAVPTDKKLPIHRKAPEYVKQATKVEILETGIKVIDKVAMVFGQMNEPPGARLRVALSGLTMAEHFRDAEGKDVLLFIDNIFRFTQAGSEVSALLGRIPSAVGYQPTLGTEMGILQERITSTDKGSVTSVQAVYVPADDLTDPAPATTFAHLD